MGKGKAKGWRPPAPGEDEGSTLYGSAAHLSGDTIASPVQLREEGRAVPKGHPNYGERPGGRWAGNGKNSNASSSGAGSWTQPARNNRLPAEQHWRAPTNVANPYMQVAEALMPATPKVAATHRVPNHASAPLPPKFSAPKVEAEAASEIERRRLEEAATADFEIRRAAAQARREQAATAAREAEARRHAGALRAAAPKPLAAAAAGEAELSGAAELLQEVKEEEAPADTSEPIVSQEPLADHDGTNATEAPLETEIERRRRLASLSKPACEAPVDEPKIELPGEAPVESEIEHRRRLASLSKPASEATVNEPKIELPGDERKEAETKRRRTDEEGSSGDVGDVGAGARKPPAKAAAPSVAMQQGLQRWAERVNGLAGDDAVLIRKCREFVRKRILKAHATGSLHATNWDNETVPTTESISEGS